jgi:hypothetical protein
METNCIPCGVGTKFRRISLFGQAVCRQPVTEVLRGRDQASSCGICGGHSDTGTGFSWNTSVFLSQDHATNEPLPSLSLEINKTEGPSKKACEPSNRSVVIFELECIKERKVNVLALLLFTWVNAAMVSCKYIKEKYESYNKYRAHLLFS